ncbi:MAG: sulfatase family protein [Alphaproteobacteria bacterium]
MIRFAFAALLIALPLPVFAADTRPNILLIVAEDMSAHIGAFGDTVAKTPALNALSAQGTNFPNAYTTSGVCAPSRAGLITGVHQVALNAQHMRTSAPFPGVGNGGPMNYEAVPPAHIKAFPELLRAQGYYTYNVTKTDYQFGDPFTIWDRNAGSAHWRDRPNADQPFFGMVNLMSTHESGLFAQTGWPRSALHFAMQLVLWQRFKDFEDVVTPAEVHVPPYYPDTPQVRATLAQLQNNVAFMDGEVQALLAQLEEDGLADNTIVIFTTDHGDGLPRGKRTLYDLGIRVPVIVRWPANLRPDQEPQGTWRHDIVSFIDFAPTLLKLAGATPLPYMAGRVFLGDDPAPPPQFVHSAIDRVDEHAQRSRAVTDGRYKLIADFIIDAPQLLSLGFRNNLAMMDDLYEVKAQGGFAGDGGLYDDTRPARQLFDTKIDPHEINNLAGHPDYAKIEQALEAELHRWMVELGDEGMPEREMIAQHWPNMEQPETAAPIFTQSGEWFVLTSETKGASIGWRIGEGAWQLYTQPIAAQKGVEAKAIRYGYKESSVSTFTVP